MPHSTVIFNNGSLLIFHEYCFSFNPLRLYLNKNFPRKREYQMSKCPHGHGVVEMLVIGHVFIFWFVSMVNNHSQWELQKKTQKVQQGLNSFKISICFHSLYHDKTLSQRPQPMITCRNRAGESHSGAGWSMWLRDKHKPKGPRSTSHLPVLAFMKMFKRLFLDLGLCSLKCLCVYVWEYFLGHGL